MSDEEKSPAGQDGADQVTSTAGYSPPNTEPQGETQADRANAPDIGLSFLLTQVEAKFKRHLSLPQGVAEAIANYAFLGGGPAFRKAGKFPVYFRDDLDAWANQRLGRLVRSTSELGDAGT
jgi:hypothetical protein